MIKKKDGLSLEYEKWKPDQYYCPYTFDTSEFLYPFHLMSLIPVPFGIKEEKPCVKKQVVQ